MNRFLLLVIILSLAKQSIVAQSIFKVANLSSRLNEISGLTSFDGDKFLAHNDSGSEAELFVLDLTGKILRTIKISNAENVDWEDITTDGKSKIFIGDIGNNNNKRKNLKIYVIDYEEARFKNEIEAEIISISYKDQTSFPPPKSELNYDSEALAYFNDSLFIFTKCRTEPFSGYSFVYKLPAIVGTYELEKSDMLYTNDKGFFFNSVTAAEFHDNNCYLLTYKSMYTFKYENYKFTSINSCKLGSLSQKEALAIRDYENIYVADERHKLLKGQNLYLVKFKRKKKKK